jgi:LmbE family N-acetylglucosaminyl deacetylase
MLDSQSGRSAVHCIASTSHKGELMNKAKLRWLVLLGFLWIARPVFSQTQVVRGADERYEADILVVVAHPDDEGFFTPYLARAINDLHKRVAVVFSTRGGSGANRGARERGPALANEREIEAREACAKLGISLVWFLDGKDTASQDSLVSLANWGHGANLERLVGLIRLTRPEVVFTHFPGIFIGENHGDHQATGVLVTEAFDLSANPLVFPSQLAGDTNQHESYLSNLQTWQPKKIYYGSDADDSQQFAGSGPAYSVREISPARKKPYWRLALDSGMAHRTQFPDEVDQISKMTDEQLDKLMSGPNTGWWPEPWTLIFGKSVVGGAPTDDVFANIKTGAEIRAAPASKPSEHDSAPRNEVVLGGAWEFYTQFRAAHGLENIRQPSTPEIGVMAGSTLLVPLVIRHADSSQPMKVNLKVEAPSGWKVVSGQGEFALSAETSTALRVGIETPALSAEELKKTVPQEVTVHAEAEGHSIGEVKLRVLLRSHALPQ